MAIRKNGKVHFDVAMLLRRRGIDPKGLKIVTFGRSPYHTIVLDDEPIGEYCHISREMSLYIDNPDIPKK